MLTSREQLFLELTNAARLNPQAEADRLLGGNLNDGVADYNARNGTSHDLSGTGTMQVLAPNQALATAALRHSQWMLAEDRFSHAGDPQYRNHPDYPGNPSYASFSNGGERMAAAGYEFSGSWTWGENIAWSGTTGRVDLDAAIVGHYIDLFESVGHRVNTLQDRFSEAGIGQASGGFTVQGTTYNASMLSQKMALSGSSVFLTGVAYDDADGDAFYDLGEGTGGLGFAAGGATASTWAAGGYVLELVASDATAVTITTASGTIRATVDLSAGNVKLDLVNGTDLHSSGNLTLGDGATSARLLGAAGLELTGNAADNTLMGGQGDDTIEGGGGTDVVVYAGNQAAYTVTEVDGTVTVTHSDTSASGSGTDTLTGVESLRFADGTRDITPPPPPPPPGEDLTAPPPDALHLTGRVHLPDGTGLSGVALRLHMDGGAAPVIFGTDSAGDGRFDLAHGTGAGRLMASAAITASRSDITAADALNVLRIAVGLDPNFGQADSFDFVAADTTRDGQVTAADALDILRFAVGLQSQGAGAYALIDGMPGAQSRTAVAYDDALDIPGTADASLDLVAVRLGDLGIYDIV